MLKCKEVTSDGKSFRMSISNMEGATSNRVNSRDKRSINQNLFAATTPIYTRKAKRLNEHELAAE